MVTLRARAAAALVLMWACSRAPATREPTPAMPGRSGVDPRFARFVDEYFAAKLAAEPSAATQLGVHDYDDRLDDMSRAGIERRRAQLETFRQRLHGFDRRGLPFDDQIDLEAIEGDIEGDLLEIGTLRLWERNPIPYVYLVGSAIDGLMKRDFAPAADRLRAGASLKQFHDAFVSQGALPIPLVRRILFR